MQTQALVMDRPFTSSQWQQLQTNNGQQVGASRQ
jgi:hypothetical protein